MDKKIADAIAGKNGKDIVIIGKGPNIDLIDVSLLKECIVINTNDSELIYPGEICVFHHGWVLDIFDHEKPRCHLYVSDKEVPAALSQIKAEYIPYNPESADFLLSRFFSETIYTEHAVIVTALRVANQIAKIEGTKRNVYLLGFDFTAKDGYTQQIPVIGANFDPEFAERIISSQEHVLQMILEEKQRLSINIIHVGNKPYSLYSPVAFNKIFSSRTEPRIEIDKSMPLSANYKVKIVAEITTNHFGDMDRLKSMIIAAKNAGADLIKLQKRDVESFYSQEKLSAPYSSPFGKSFRDYRHGIELSREQFLWVNDFCKEIGIGWFASILDAASYEFIREFNPEMIKLPSTISEHKQFLSYVADDFSKDVVISTGYTNKVYEEFIFNSFKKSRNIYLLQCTSSYPTPKEDAQIGVVRHYYNLSRKDSRIIPGLSSHDIGSLCAQMAVAAGALMIEKHVKFGDVSWSHFDEVAIDLANGDFDQFVRDVRLAERIVGDEEKVIHASEHHKYWLGDKK